MKFKNIAIALLISLATHQAWASDPSGEKCPCEAKSEVKCEDKKPVAAFDRLQKNLDEDVVKPIEKRVKDVVPLTILATCQTQYFVESVLPHGAADELVIRCFQKKTEEIDSGHKLKAKLETEVKACNSEKELPAKRNCLIAVYKKNSGDLFK